MSATRTKADALADGILASMHIASGDPGAQGLVPYLRAFDATVRFSSLPIGLCGRTNWSESGHVIEVAQRHPATRKVFTIAHEIGHILLDEASVDLDLVRRLPVSATELERLCDNMAGRILMPEPWVREAVTRTLDGGQILEIADSIGVSSTALIIRFEQVGFPVVFVRARKGGNGEWTACQATGRLSRTRAAQLDLGALRTCNLGTTRFGKPSPRPEWAVPDSVVGEVRKGTTDAIIWFTEPRDARTSHDKEAGASGESSRIVWSSRTA